MLKRTPGTVGKTATAQIEASRARQADIEDQMASAIKTGDTAVADARQRELAQEMRTRTQLHRVGAAVPSYEKGGKVKKTGLALVHEGEEVVPADKPKSRAGAAMSGEGKDKKSKKKDSKKKKGSKKKPHRMEIRHAASGGYIATHHFKPEPDEMGRMGPSPESEDHAISDMAQLHDHMDEHMSQDDEEAEGQQPPEEEAAESEAPPALPPQRM